MSENKAEVDKEEKQYSYLIKKSFESHDINSVWDKEIWNKTASLSLDHFMGDKPSHFPKIKVKLRYDKDYIYLIFSIMDRYIKAVAKKTNGRVWEDSCVEFFFTPGPDVERGYFNFEANCKGVFLFQYHLHNGINGFVSEDDCKRIKTSMIFHVCLTEQK